MFQGILALLGRSLRVDSRSWQVHLARFGLLVAIYISLAFAFATIGRFGAPGLRFFRAIVWLNVAFMTLLGVGFFSTAVSEEKEEDTLGLMQMAGISPLGILVGKLGGRLVQALLLIAVQYPFNLLSVTMGGITTNQVRCAFIGLTAYLVFIAGLGILCSTVAPRSRSAASMMILGLLTYVAVPYAATQFHRILVIDGNLTADSWAANLLGKIAETCLLLQINFILISSFADSPWTIQVVSNVVAGALLFVTSWVLFPICTRAPSTAHTSRGWVPVRKRTWMWGFAPGRPGINPFLWKDFYFVGGGVGMIFARTGFCAALLAVSVLLGDVWWKGGGAYPFQYSIGLYQVLLLCMLATETALLAVRVFQEEIRGQTLATLIMLPESTTNMIYSKLAGALIGTLPGFGYLTATVLMAGGRQNISDFLERPAGFFFLSNFVLVPHIAAVLSLYLRWGCVPLGIGFAIASLFGWVSVFEAFRVGPGDSIVWVATVIAAFICVSSHLWVVSRVPVLAARS